MCRMMDVSNEKKLSTFDIPHTSIMVYFYVSAHEHFWKLLIKAKLVLFQKEV